MHYFYTLYSLKDNNLYKGVTENVAKRFNKHNSGGNKSTAHRKPFVLVYIEILETKAEALALERYYKSLEGGTALKQKLISSGILNPDGSLC